MQNGTKDRRQIKPHTDLCRQKRWSKIGDKEQIKRRWKEHFQELLNKNKHKHETVALALEQNQTNTEWGNRITSINIARNPGGHREVKQ